MEPFLSKDGKQFITHEEVTVEHYSISVIDATDRNKIVDNGNGPELSLDGYGVALSDHEKEWLAALKDTGKIPKLYVVRLGEPLYLFICGFDLLTDGGYWVGSDSKVFKRMVDALDHLKGTLEGKEFFISLEEPMRS